MLSEMALLMLIIYSNYEVNRTSTFKIIGHIKFHVKVAFERGITQKLLKLELSFLSSQMALFLLKKYYKYELNRTSSFKVIGHIKFHIKVAFKRGITQKL